MIRNVFLIRRAAFSSKPQATQVDKVMLKITPDQTHENATLIDRNMPEATFVVEPATLIDKNMPKTPPFVEQTTLLNKVKHGWAWVRNTAKEKGKPFIAWYVTLYFGGLLTAYGAVRIHDGVEPEFVKSWAYKLHFDKLMNIETIDMSKKNCEYLAALLLNEAVDTPRLILAVLTIDRVILLARKLR